MLNKIHDHIFENKDVVLDGKSFTFCTFKNCNIIVKVGNTELKSCKFEDNKLTLGDNAQTIATIIELFFPGKLPFFDPPNPKGKDIV